MFDLLIIGGGVNGVGIARDAAGRGLRVALVEATDLAGATSSASSKLVHGGLRYLETYEFRLVRESLGERETLLRMAPHIIWPMRFVLPVHKAMRPAWMLRIGLFLYDHLAKRAVLPATRTLNLRKTLQGAPLDPALKTGFEYSDCWVDDARLVALNAVDAAARGADIRTRTRCTRLERGTDHWTAHIEAHDGTHETLDARVVINAAGPWVDDVLGLFGRKSNRGNIRLVKGSHIVTRRLFEGDHAYIFQSADGRVIFAIPYEDEFTLIGTTDEEIPAMTRPIEIAPHETDYLCGAVSRYFATPVTPDDIVWSYAGVRPLFDDKSESASVVTRDYVFDLDDEAGMAPILSIFGGKLTTYRKLAEHALEKVAPHLPGMGKSWTATSHLPGGAFGLETLPTRAADLARAYPWLPAPVARRWLRSYGTSIPMIIGAARDTEALGQHFGAGLYAAEVDYLRTHEFARSADDILWRRTKLGLRLSADERAALEAYMTAAPAL